MKMLILLGIIGILILGNWAGWTDAKNYYTDKSYKEGYRQALIDISKQKYEAWRPFYESDDMKIGVNEWIGEVGSGHWERGGYGRKANYNSIIVTEKPTL